jgi:hypothetical protein
MTSRRVLDDTDVSAAHALLRRLRQQGTAVTSLTITPTGFDVQTADPVTPPEGIATLRAIEDDPAELVTLRRRAGYAVLAAKVVGRRCELRVRRLRGASS